MSIWGDWDASPTPMLPWGAPRSVKPRPSPPAERARSLAERGARAGRLARAERLARHAYGLLRRSGGDVRETVFLLGQIALARGNPGDAGPWFHGALAASDRGRRADALDIEALLWLALAAFIQGDRALAETGDLQR